jgi:hypothetical protein
MSTGSTTPKWRSWLFWGVLLGACLVIIGMCVTSSPVLGKWYIDPSSADFVPGGGEQSRLKGMEFKRLGRFETFGYNFTIRGSYTLMASNRVRLENKEISGTFKGKHVSEKVGLPAAFTTRFYQYDKARQELIEEDPMISPFRFTRTPP